MDLSQSVKLKAPLDKYSKSKNKAVLIILRSVIHSLRLYLSAEFMFCTGSDLLLCRCQVYGCGGWGGSLLRLHESLRLIIPTGSEPDSERKARQGADTAAWRGSYWG